MASTTFDYFVSLPSPTSDTNLSRLCRFAWLSKVPWLNGI